jgi:hypothetical protein
MAYTQVPYEPNGNYSGELRPSATLNVCRTHERIHAHEVLLSCLGEAGKWAFEYLARELARDAYDDKQVEESYDG